MSVTYTAALPVRDQAVLFLSSLLHGERRRRGTRTDSRALSPFKQAVLILRWFLDATRVAQLACDNTISKSTAYDYLHEGITVLAAHAPKLESALLAAKIAGHDHISIDGTLIETDRCRTPGPTTGVDLWWSGKHANREHPGHHRTGWLATVDLTGPTRARTRHHRTADSHRDPSRASHLDSPGPAGPGRPGLRRRSRHHHGGGQETPGWPTHRGPEGPQQGPQRETRGR